MAALWLERLSFPALIYSLIGLGIAFYSRYLNGWQKIVCHLTVFLWSIALVLHWVPGFNNLHVLDKVTTGSDSIPFTLYLNLDKPLIIFAMLLLLPNMLGERRLIEPKQKVFLAVLFSLLPITAWLLGIVKPELSLPSWIWLFALNNLLLTCVAEEVLFRGYLQRQMSQWLSPWLGIAAASLLFGLAHFAGGIEFVIVASLAGAMYGLTYFWTGKLLWAILIHFSFNLVHLLFFTYPMAL
ncbi:lysostaphin resistance A-like protein [Photobacterium minamisatsumaniensis]|uniref:CPBP family intramembrane glutamic endopeptidase n=1 Tax=Photobacterium minamisatsumaniensis TaxID=2910233 RepID=UPI003D0C90EA